MRLRFFGILDRYVLKQWAGAFLLSAVGVPAVAVIIDLSERFAKISDRHVPIATIFYGQLFLFPSKMAILFPAAVLFATVFTLNSMGRHSELTAVQGGGVSFYRLILPMLLLATLAVPADYELQELAGVSTTRQKQLQGESTSGSDKYRHAFPYASESGWTWTIQDMYQSPTPVHASGILGSLPIAQSARRWIVTADSAIWVATRHQWSLRHGTSYLVSDSGAVSATLGFTALDVARFTETPATLMTEEKKAEEMSVSELRRYLEQLRLSGGRPGVMSVELQLKYAVPVACLVVALFGAPLAITNARAGAAIGLAIALGTTLAYLTGIQIMKSVGAKELLTPFLAAWSMNGVFLLLAIVLLARVRS